MRGKHTFSEKYNNLKVGRENSKILDFIDKNMRKFLKIASITLASLLGLILVAAGVLVYWVFTPERLTPVVRDLADEFITCDYEIGQVDLTFFSTFPEFGLRADGILVENPVAGAQSDTVLAAKKVVARIDIMALLQQGELSIREVALADAQLNAFISEDGTANFDVLSLPQDTTPEDTTEASFIRSVSLNDLTVSLIAHKISLLSLRDSIDILLLDPAISLATRMQQEKVVGSLKADFPHVDARYANADYASGLAVSLSAPFALDLQMDEPFAIQHAAISLDDARLAVNSCQITLTGDAALIPQIHTDLALSTNTVRVSELLKIVPAALFTMPEDIHADASVRLAANVRGDYSDSIMPIVSGHLYVSDAEGSMESLPYTLTNVAGDAAFLLDFNGKTPSYAVIENLYAETKQSNVSASGRVDDLLGDMQLDMQLDVNLHLPDVQYFLPENITAEGQVKGLLNAQIGLADLTAMQLDRGKIQAELNLGRFAATYDSMLIRAPKANLSLAIPSARKGATPASSEKARKMKRKPMDFISGKLILQEGLTVQQTDALAAELAASEIELCASNFLSSNPIIAADVTLASRSLKASLQMADSIGNTVPASVDSKQPNLQAYVEYDNRATLPTLSCAFNMEHLAAAYDTITAEVAAPQGRVSMANEAESLRATINANQLMARMGSMADVRSGKLALSASARHDKGKENVLLEWRPRLRFDMNNAVAHLRGIEPEVKVPACKFEYSNREFNIDTARVELAHSSFSLAGKVQNIGPWLEDKGLLTGNLRFISDYANIDELLALISDDSEETAAATEATEESSTSVFMVPKGVDITLYTSINLASAFSQSVRELGGMVYIRDGVMVIEEMGFICEAAKLQLTALYKTPRRNHIFCGLDYHMTNINVEELVNMIPQVDTLLPMLRSFRGAANFHLAAETYLNDKYELKTSTTRGAMSIDAKDLTLLDGEVFAKIAKLLTFKKKTENKIDSISAEVALYKSELDIYPFLISCDKWMGAVGGRHHLDGTMDYHINLLSPLYLGVHVGGNLNTFEKLSDLDIKLAKCIYAKDFKPVFRGEVDTRSADIRAMIRKALESNVK